MCFLFDLRSHPPRIYKSRSPGLQLAAAGPDERRVVAAAVPGRFDHREAVVRREPVPAVPGATLGTPQDNSAQKNMIGNEHVFLSFSLQSSYGASLAL